MRHCLNVMEGCHGQVCYDFFSDTAVRVVLQEVFKHPSYRSSISTDHWRKLIPLSFNLVIRAPKSNAF